MLFLKKEVLLSQPAKHQMANREINRAFSNLAAKETYFPKELGETKTDPKGERKLGRQTQL